MIEIDRCSGTGRKQPGGMNELEDYDTIVHPIKIVSRSDHRFARDIGGATNVAHRC